mmetsp:Transcript_6265/g.24420  ORF Transcript_6265/g.24420 Transcript_6265/m.24420 type:complete len:398 (-) Transcript_6265:933-2126(-)
MNEITDPVRVVVHARGQELEAVVQRPPPLMEGPTRTLRVYSNQWKKQPLHVVLVEEAHVALLLGDIDALRVQGQSESFETLDKDALVGAGVKAATQAEERRGQLRRAVVLVISVARVLLKIPRDVLRTEQLRGSRGTAFALDEGIPLHARQRRRRRRLHRVLEDQRRMEHRRNEKELARKEPKLLVQRLLLQRLGARVLPGTEVRDGTGVREQRPEVAHQREVLEQVLQQLHAAQGIHRLAELQQLKQETQRIADLGVLLREDGRLEDDDDVAQDLHVAPEVLCDFAAVHDDDSVHGTNSRLVNQRSNHALLQELGPEGLRDLVPQLRILQRHHLLHPRLLREESPVLGLLLQLPVVLEHRRHAREDVVPQQKLHERVIVQQDDEAQDLAQLVQARP